MKGKQFVNFLAYLSITLIAVVLVLELIFQKTIGDSAIVSAMSLVAQCIAYTITAVFAFAYARSKRNIGFMIAYVVAIILIIVMIVL